MRVNIKSLPDPGAKDYKKQGQYHDVRVTLADRHAPRERVD